MPVHVGEFEVVPGEAPPPTAEAAPPAGEPSADTAALLAEELDRRLARREQRAARLEAC